MLNAGQEKIKQEAVDWFYNSSEQVFEIDGKAGTGKSYLMYEILKALNLEANQYMPMAYTGQASIIMRTKGFTTARSIHSSLYEVVDVYDNTKINTQFGITKKRKEFRKRAYIDPNVVLFFIDEGYMVPEYMVRDIESFGIKIITTGDQHQLPPIGDKPGYFTGKRKIHRLTQLMRQSENDPIIYLAQRATRGLPIHYGNYGNQVLVIRDDEFTPQMISFADCIGCGTNKTRETINCIVRQLAGFNSTLPMFGERVICRNNNYDQVMDGISLANGLTGTVISQPDPSSFQNKDFFTINFKPDLINGAFYNLPINYEYFISPYDIKADIKRNKNRYITGELFEYAYALTTHLMQGAEYEKGIYIEEFLRPQIQNQLNYTGITRFKKGLIYIKKSNKYLYIPNIQKYIK